MKIIDQQWAADPNSYDYLFMLRGRIGFDVKQVALRCCGEAYLSEEGREVTERAAYNTLREAFGQDAEKSPL